MRPIVERVGERFRLEREIGSGGMSTVYLGRDEVLDRPVAVKILRGGFGESDVGGRFEREGRTAARLSHANIVQVYDAGKDENADRDVSYIVMEYISGGDLKNMMDKDGPLSGKQLSRIGAEVAAGLAHAHERGIVHRDIKPQNVLMDEYGRPKLTDFGIARALDATVQTTKTGSYLGTALYSSPEQLKGEEITPKSDVYSLGITLYHATVGEPPFSGGPIEVASQQMTQDPEPPRRRGAKITPDMESLILSCLSKNPDDRPTSDELKTKLLQAGAVAQRNPEAYGGAANAAGAAGAGGLAGVAKAAGDAGAAVREKFGSSEGGASRNPRRIDGRPTETVSLPTRTFQSGGRDRGLFILAAAALLFIVFVGLGAWALTSGGGEAADSSGSGANGAAVEPETPDGAGGSGEGEGGEGGAADEAAGGEDAQNGGSGDAQGEGSEDGDSGDGDSGDGDSGDGDSGDGDSGDSQPSDPGPLPPTEEAASTVFDMYVALPFGRFDESWGYLSSRYQDEVGSIGEWESRYESVSFVRYSQSPQATLDGDEARVDFTADLTRTDGTETVSGTWIAVNEDGEWKLDRLEETAAASSSVSASNSSAASNPSGASVSSQSSSQSVVSSQSVSGTDGDFDGGG
ncbi:MAG: serine/threonine protein kinase [Rubrobacter sp.]|nr:serine/threonine protein kinase [Rubrobacter sp.]